MNPLDRIIAAVSPETALKRECARRTLHRIQNSGYGNYGASLTKKELKGWNSAGGSATEDVQENLSTLRVRARDLYMGAPIATGALKTYRTNVVGSGLTPKPVIDAEALRITEEQADALEKQISREFNLWADSTACDAERMSTFYELQQMAFLNWLMSGDVFVLLQTKERAGTPYQTCIQLIEADRVCTPGNYLDISSDEKIVGGVEVNDKGEVVAYHICKRHPLSYRGTALDRENFVRVEAYGAVTGRRNVLHVMSRERIGARRGVPILAPVIEALKQLGRYTEAELDAAVVQGFQAMVIQQPIASAEVPLGEVGEAGEESDAEFAQSQNKGEIKLGPGAIVDLAPGEEMKPFLPSRPNATFDGFVNAIAKQIGTALELPHELLLKQFTASYSASRAALLEAWKSFDQQRDWMTEKLCQPVYEEWLSEAVALGRIDAPGFFADPMIRKAYCAAQWYGPTQGQLDPVKEVEAAELRVRYGFSTRAREAMELTGTDIRDNLITAKRENELMEEAGFNMEPMKPIVTQEERKDELT